MGEIGISAGEEALTGLFFGVPAAAVPIGSPGASRAVGAACASNPLPIVIPCHRVVRSDGSIGGYLGGVPVKRWLLELERRNSP